MVNFPFTAVAVALALAALAAAPVSAQSTAGPAPSPSPQGAAHSPTPPLAWRSAFDGYQPYTDAKVLPWKQSNDTVGAVGGWRAYAREAQASEPKAEPAPELKPSPMPATPATPGADPHAGHGKP